MKVSSSGYYSWLNRVLSNRAIENQQLTKSIEQVFVKNRNVYGTRRIAKILAKNDILISRNRIGKLMASAGLVCKTKRRFKVTTDSKHNNPVSPNLLARQFIPNINLNYAFMLRLFGIKFRRKTFCIS